MAFRFQVQTSEAPAPNLTPLIDVVFLLLIFFMVSSTFLEESAVEVRLPEAAGKPPENLPKSLNVKVLASGDYRVNDQTIPADNPRHLAAMLERHGSADEPVIVEADGRAPHQSVMTLLDLSAQIGLKSVHFKAQDLNQSSGRQ